MKGLETWAISLKINTVKEKFNRPWGEETKDLVLGGKKGHKRSNDKGHSSYSWNIFSPIF